MFDRGYRIARGVLVALCGAVLFAAGSARALDFNGETLPIVPGEHDDCESDVWYCINQHESDLGYDGEEIDVVETATIDQETFNPLCNLSFEVLYKGASYINVFGWYEVGRDGDGNPVKPAPEQMHVMLGCDTPVGEIVNLPNPEGVTEIGFFLANNHADSCVANADGTLQETQENLFFSERSLNDDDGRVHLLIWQSRANPNAFYFGWEDQLGGGDNDFEDLLTFVTGIQCAGGGDLCDTGEPGVCAQGVEQCRDGVLTCVGLQSPHDESCNGTDDDCDGEIDDGDDLCPAREVCHQGKCQPRCGGGEFQCGNGLVCDAMGVCVEPECLGMTCPEGTVCRGGECLGACDDVVCPYASACRGGVCVDVCAGIECDDGFACSVSYPDGMDGEAVGLCSSCGCSGCGDGFACQENLCVEDACLDMTCQLGFRCEAGECVDNCDGAECPVGMKCDAGACVEDPNSGAGGAGGASGADSSDTSDTSGSGGSFAVGSTGVGGTRGDGDTGGPLEGTPDSGCGCRLAGSGTGSSALWLWGVAIAGAASRRRRHAGASASRR